MASDDAGEAKGSPSRVVRLKLRYKSATVDEFIEKYALDVSPRGIHVNIAKPLAVGTLVKLEIRLASEQMVIKGAGRVVWTRDRAQGTGTQPAGLWIKFLQIDEPTKAFIETLVSARADAGLAYEEHAEEEAEDATVVGSPAQSHEEKAALPVPAAPRLRATLVGMTAPAVPPSRPRFPSLPPIPTPPPPKVASLPPPAPSLPPPLAPTLPRLRATLVGIAAPMTSPPRTRMASLPPIPTPPPPKAASLRPPPAPAFPAFEEQGETDADEATVVWDDAPVAAALPAQPHRASLPPIPTPPPPRARSAPPLPARAYEEQPEKDAEDVTVIFDHEPSHQEGSAVPVLVASPPVVAPAPPVVATAQQRSARAGAKTVVTRRLSPWSYRLRRWGPMGAWVALGFFATVVLVLAVRSTDWFRALTAAASAPVVAEGGATSAATPVTAAEPVTSAKTDPVLARPEVEVPADAAPAAPAATTTPAEEAGPPVPKPAPVTRAITPVPVAVPTVRAKPKPKPAPTIDDGF
jgi:uncharacterized protein (TIGR02266 family)